MRGVGWRRGQGWGFVVGNIILRPTFLLTSTHTWIGGEKIPREGGCILVVNHLTHLDPLVIAHFVYDQHRLPRYLAKAALFRSNRFVAGVLRSTRQIPVERLTTHAVSAYDAAVAAVRAGDCVVVYPEGTLTRDPDQWPMRGKTGAARIALATGAPVIPVAHWGAQELLPAYATRPRPWPRKHLTVKVGDPVPLDDLRARAEQTSPEQTSPEQTGPGQPGVVQEATDRIMEALVEVLEQVRGQKAPKERFDPAKAGVRLIGNPHPHERRKKKRKS